MRTFVALAVLLLTPPIAAQPAAPPPATEPVLAPSFSPAGSWEGYDSGGCLRVIQIAALEPDHFDAQVWTYRPGVVSPEYQGLQFRVVVGAGDHRDLFVVDDGPSLDVVWYGPDALLVRLPDGVQTVLARTDHHAPVSPARDLAPPVGSTVPLSPVVQARLALLEGRWASTLVGSGGLEPEPTATFDFSILDAPSGRFRLTIRDGDRTEVEVGRVVGGTGNNLVVAHDGGDEDTLEFIGEDVVEIRIEDQVLLRLERLGP